MYIGEQLNDLSDENLAWAAQMGVAHIAVNSTHGPGTEEVENPDGTWRVEAIRAVQRRLADYGLTMDVLSLDLQSTYVTRQRFPRIMLGEEGWSSGNGGLEAGARPGVRRLVRTRVPNWAGDSAACSGGLGGLGGSS